MAMKEYKKSTITIVCFLSMIIGIVLGLYLYFYQTFSVEFALAKLGNNYSQMWVANHYSDKLEMTEKGTAARTKDRKNSEYYEDKAIYWYKKAANHGNVDAQLMYGLLDQNINELKKLALQGNTEAIYNIVIIGSVSKNPSDIEEACAWQTILCQLKKTHSVCSKKKRLDSELTNKQIEKAKTLADKYMSVLRGKEY